LTLLTSHWLSVISQKIPSLKNHLITLDLPSVLASSPNAPNFTGRSMQVRKFKVLPIESIVRGYITGSAWSEYKKTGTVHGLPMPQGLQESQKLEEPLWTPSTKAEVGDKDENITPAKGMMIKQFVKFLSADAF
jgi:phosphoribosylaminoimidazole-succinocarboxamide synthase